MLVLLLCRLQHHSAEPALAQHPGCLPDTAGHPHTKLCAPFPGQAFALYPHTPPPLTSGLMAHWMGLALLAEALYNVCFIVGIV